MKLVAIKHISSQRPKGTVFEETGMRARVLLAIKAAVVAPVERRAPEPVAPAPIQEPSTEPVKVEPAPRRRSFTGHKPA